MQYPELKFIFQMQNNLKSYQSALRGAEGTDDILNTMRCLELELESLAQKVALAEARQCRECYARLDEGSVHKMSCSRGGKSQLKVSVESVHPFLDDPE